VDEIMKMVLLIIMATASFCFSNGYAEDGDAKNDRTPKKDSDVPPPNDNNKALLTVAEEGDGVSGQIVTGFTTGEGI
jgi:hypothetical protein